MSMIVAVAADFELPPQQSEMFGHRASSQTVCKLRPRRSFLIFLYDELSGIGVFNHEGKRVISFCLPFGPTKAVFRAYASEGSRGGSLPSTKSENEGPVFNLSAKCVGRTRGLLVGKSIEGGSEVAVAKDRRRFEGRRLREEDSERGRGRNAIKAAVSRYRGCHDSEGWIKATAVVVMVDEESIQSTNC